MEKWITEHLEPIVFAVVAAWFAFTRWLLMRLYGRHEARMAALERRQDDHEHEMRAVSRELTQLINEHYRGLDGKIDRVLGYIINREPNQRATDQRGDKNDQSNHCS